MLLCPHIHEIAHVFCSPLVLANMGEEKRGHTVSESSEIIGAWPHKTMNVNQIWKSMISGHSGSISLCLTLPCKSGLGTRLVLLPY